MTDNVMPMAWNQPGGQGKKNNGDGPPDLEQVFKDLGGKFKKLLGIRGGNTGSANNNKFNGEFLAILVLGAGLVAYLVSGFYTISPYEQGVITRFGKFTNIVSPGLHWLPHFVDRVERVNTETIKSVKRSGWMLTKDENIVLVEIEVQYRIIDAEKYLFNISTPDLILGQAADSALRQVIGDSLTDDVLTDKKQQIADAIKQQLEQTLKVYDSGFLIEALNFRDARPPEAVKDAFDDVTKSREDRERLKLEAEAYSNKILPEAEGVAEKIVADAEAYRESVTLDAQGEAQHFDLILPGYQRAPQVTKTRMYIESMQQVLSNTTKVVAGSNGSNNLIYLPLDKILEKNNNPQQKSVEVNKEEAKKE